MSVIGGNSEVSALREFFAVWPKGDIHLGHVTTGNIPTNATLVKRNCGHKPERQIRVSIAVAV